MAGRFWVGGAGTWDGSDTSHWAATSGGAAGETAPTTADTVTFDSNSGSGVVSVAATATSGNCTINQSTITVQLAASVSLATTSVIVLTGGTLDLNDFDLAGGYFDTNNTNARAITSGAGRFLLSGNNGVVVTAQQLGNLTVDTNPTFVLNYSGSTGTRTVRWGITSGGTEAKSAIFHVTAGTDTVTLQTGGVYAGIDFTGFAGTWTNGTHYLFGDLTLSAGMTVGSGAGVLNLVKSSGSATIASNGKTLDFPITVGPTTFGTPTAEWSFADALTQGPTRAFTLTNGTVKLKDGVTSTVGAFATSGSNQKRLQSSTDGAQATLSQASGTVNATKLTIKDIAATGGATFNAPYLGGCFNVGGNTGWVFGVQLVDAAGSALRQGLRLGL